MINNDFLLLFFFCIYMYTYLCFFTFLCTFIYLFLITAGLALKTHLPFEHQTLQQGRSGGGGGGGVWLLGLEPRMFFQKPRIFWVC